MRKKAYRPIGSPFPTLPGWHQSFPFDGPYRVTEEHLKMPWAGYKNGKKFRCYLCGYKFKLGDYFRLVYTNSTPGCGGNPNVCENCDGPDVIEKWKQMHIDARTKFWWFTERD